MHTTSAQHTLVRHRNEWCLRRYTVNTSMLTTPTIPHTPALCSSLKFWPSMCARRLRRYTSLATDRVSNAEMSAEMADCMVITSWRRSDKTFVYRSQKFSCRLNASCTCWSVNSNKGWGVVGCMCQVVGTFCFARRVMRWTIAVTDCIGT